MELINDVHRSFSGVSSVGRRKMYSTFNLVVYTAKAILVATFMVQMVSPGPGETKLSVIINSATWTPC